MNKKINQFKLQVELFMRIFRFRNIKFAYNIYKSTSLLNKLTA